MYEAEATGVGAYRQHDDLVGTRGDLRGGSDVVDTLDVLGADQADVPRWSGGHPLARPARRATRVGDASVSHGAPSIDHPYPHAEAAPHDAWTEGHTEALPRAEMLTRGSHHHRGPAGSIRVYDLGAGAADHRGDCGHACWCDQPVVQTPALSQGRTTRSQGKGEPGIAGRQRVPSGRVVASTPDRRASSKCRRSGHTDSPSTLATVTP